MKSKLLSISLLFLVLSGFSNSLTAQEVLWKEQSAWEGVPEYYQKWNYPDFKFSRMDLIASLFSSSAALKFSRSLKIRTVATRSSFG